MATQETGLDRLKKVPLWQWGLLCIVSALAAQAVTVAFRSPNKGLMSLNEQGQAFGQAVGVGLIVVVGIVLIVVHFVRKK